MGNNYTTADSLKTVEELAGAQSTKVTEENTVETSKTKNNLEKNNQSADSLKTVEELAGAQSTKVTEENETTIAPLEESESKDETSATVTSTPISNQNNKRIYSMSELIAKGYKLSFLTINRDINPNALKKKEASIKAHHVVSPSLIVSARQCLDESLEVVNDKGDVITYDTPELDSYYVLIDGQHRNKAVLNLNKEPKIHYENYFYFPLEQNTGTTVVDMLRESNVTTNPWKGTDYLTQILNQPKDAKMNKMLEWVKDTSKECGDTASWLWAVLDLNHPHSKSNLIAASKNINKLKKLANTDNFNYGKELYKHSSQALGKSLTKLKVTPTWMIEKWNQLLDNNCKPDATKRLCDFLRYIKEKSNPDTFKEVLKRDKDHSKDYKIKAKLDELYAQFEAKQN